MSSDIPGGPKNVIDQNLVNRRITSRRYCDDESRNLDRSFIIYNEIDGKSIVARENEYEKGERNCGLFYRIVVKLSTCT